MYWSCVILVLELSCDSIVRVHSDLKEERQSSSNSKPRHCGRALMPQTVEPIIVCLAEPVPNKSHVINH